MPDIRKIYKIGTGTLYRLKKSIEEIWYSALVLAVMLPVICCTLDGTKNGYLAVNLI